MFVDPAAGSKVGLIMPFSQPELAAFLNEEIIRAIQRLRRAIEEYEADIVELKAEQRRRKGKRG